MSWSEKQAAYLQGCDHRWNVKTGAVRSGKTFLDTALVIPKRVLRCRGEGLILLLGHTRGTLERNILEPMRDLWGPELVGTMGSDNTLRLFGKKVYALGADKATQAPKLQGAAVEYCYGDEVTTWHPEVFQMLKSRLSCPHSHFDGTCNPDRPGHWFKEFLDSGADIFCQSYTIDDNPYLTREFVENLKREYQGTVYYERYILGHWAAAQGLVYPMFSQENLWDGTPGPGDYYISLDYGTLNPTAMGLWRVYDGYAVMEKEYYHDARATGRQKTDQEYYLDLEEFAGDLPVRRVIVDPSAASFKATIRAHGRFHVQDADNSVLDGIRCTAQLLGDRRLLVHPGCRNTLRELENYRWDESAATDQVIKDQDHSMDQMRYLVKTLWGRCFRRRR